MSGGKKLQGTDGEEFEDLTASIYDTDPTEEDDLWFLPPLDETEEEGPMPLLRTGAATPLFNPAEWRAAQDSLSAELADLALTFGMLDERMRSGPEGWRHRLALLEVADLGWWTGDRISAERLALWIGLRLGATGDDTLALARAGWAVRRLTSGAAPNAGGWEDGLSAFLGRTTPAGHEVPEAVSDLSDVMTLVAHLHPMTQSAMIFHAWRALGQGMSNDAEAAVLAARHGASAGRDGALFMPVCFSGPGALRGMGTAEQKLNAWYTGAAQATLAALLLIDRVSTWHDRAVEETRDLSGRTPPALIEVLTAWPMITAPLAEELTGASRAAVQRNLDKLSQRGLIREITGQGRYRVWTASV